MTDAKIDVARCDGESDALRRLVKGELGGRLDVATDGTLYARLAQARDGAEFVLRIASAGWHPMRPPSYGFVDPATLADSGRGCWPDDGQQAFKTECNPRWICMPGMVDYRDNRSIYWFDSKRDLIFQTALHAFARISSKEGA